MTTPYLLPSFDRYQTQGILGEGGFAEVLAAWDPAAGRQVALKALLPHLSRHAGVRGRFLDEARAIAALRHPNIVTFHDVGESDGRPYYAMELIDGPTLAQLLEGQGACTPEQVAAWLRPLASAVDYPHAAGFVHRDIKAANVMLDRSGRLVLMDLGIARALDGTHHTLTGALLGSEEAIAPEQVLHEQAGPPADIYGLGVLVYRLLAGRPPFTGSSGHVLYAHANLPPPSLRGFRPGLPVAVEAAVLHALAKEPAARPPSAGAFAQEFAAAVTAATAAPAALPAREERTTLPDRVPAPAPPPARPKPRNLRPLVAGAIAVIVLLAGALSVLVFAAVSLRQPRPKDAESLHAVWVACAAPGVPEDAYLSDILARNPGLSPNPQAPLPQGTILDLRDEWTKVECNGTATGAVTVAGSPTRASGSRTPTATATPPRSATSTGPAQYVVQAADKGGLSDVWSKCAAPGVSLDDYKVALVILNPVLEGSGDAIIEPGQVLQLPPAQTRPGPLCNGSATPIPTPSLTPPPTATPAQPTRTPTQSTPPPPSRTVAPAGGGGGQTQSSATLTATPAASPTVTIGAGVTVHPSASATATGTATAATPSSTVVSTATPSVTPTVAATPTPPPWPAMPRPWTSPTQPPRDDLPPQPSPPL